MSLSNLQANKCPPKMPFSTTQLSSVTEEIGIFANASHISVIDTSLWLQ